MKKILILLFLFISTITYGQQWFGSGIIADDSVVTTDGAKFGALGVLEVPYNWGATGNYRIEVNDTTLNKWIEIIASRTLEADLDSKLDDVGETLTANFLITRSASGGGTNAVRLNQTEPAIYYSNGNKSNAILISGTYALLQSVDADNNLSAQVYTDENGYAIIGRNIAGNNFKGVKIKDSGSEATIDWDSDPNEGLLLTTQDRVREMLNDTSSSVRSYAETYADTYIASQSINSIVSSPTVTQDGFAITWDNTVGEYTLSAAGSGSGINSLVEDTSPQLGGNLDPNGFTVGNATAADLTKLNGITSTVTELNYTDGVTSAIQDQLDDKMPLSGSPTLTGNLTITTPIGNSFIVQQNSIDKLSIGDSYTILASDGTFPSSITLSDFPTDPNLFLFKNSGSSISQMTYQTNAGASAKGYMMFDSNSGNGYFEFRKDTLATNTYAIVRGAYPVGSQDLATKQYVDDNIGGGSGISSLVEDTSPQLGGNLDLNGNTIGTANITNTEIGYLDGASSNIQTQLDNRVPLSSSTHDITGTSNWTLRKNNNGNVGISKTSGTGNLVLSNSTANEIQLTNTNASGNITVNNSGIRTDSTIVNEKRLQQFTGGLKTEELSINDWNMDVNSNINVELPSHIPWNKVRSISVMIRQDNPSASMYPLDQYNSVLSVSTQGGVFIVYNPTDCSCTYGAINLVRLSGGIFDTANFDSTSYNRGWITITYNPN